MVQLDFTNSSFETCHYELRKKLAVGLRIIVILMGLCVNDELLLCILNVLPFSRRATNLKIQSNYFLPYRDVSGSIWWSLGLTATYNRSCTLLTSKWVYRNKRNDVSFVHACVLEIIDQGFKITIHVFIYHLHVKWDFFPNEYFHINCTFAGV